MSSGFPSDSLQYIKGVGPKRAKLLQKMGIFSIEDALYYLPYRFEDRSSIRKISQLEPGMLTTVSGEIALIEFKRIPGKIAILEITVSDGSGIVKAKWFNQPYMKKVFKRGQKLFLSGKIKVNKYHGVGFEMETPDYEFITNNSDSYIHTSRIVPVYRTTTGLGQKTMRTLMFNIVEKSASRVKEFIPEDIRRRNSFVAIDKALLSIHFPDRNDVDIDTLNSSRSEYHRRLSFDELFLFQLGVQRIKKSLEEEKGIKFIAEPSLTQALVDSLPFRLTNAQHKVIGEIFDDMEKPGPMNRLVQGDVGSGKTVVALTAMLKAVENGYQASMMVPTEILAQQHYFNIMNLLKGIDVNCQLITSKVKKGDGAPDIMIGTHALIQEGVAFDNLGLVVIDEQHRFGVRQRAMLRKKGINPDVLVMTATPIPRTLAMTLYGDLEHSVIDELPPGRTPVETMIVKEPKKQTVYDLIRREVNAGGQAYVVYPLIEDSENVNIRSAEIGYEALNVMFPEMRIELMHGRMKPPERQSIMDQFKSGEVDILVSTTVIEVGVDVPNANIMVIVHAERFGLSQLHQLRGRVGRGKKKSFCILLAYGDLNEEAMRRLNAMKKTNDGFIIAEEDLDIRGPGDFFGTAQSGYPELRVANLIRDNKILLLARKEASDLLKDDPYLEKHSVLRGRVNQMWKGRSELYKTV
jgi:ATP-dependent DNA helicase RecG